MLVVNHSRHVSLVINFLFTCSKANSLSSKFAKMSDEIEKFHVDGESNVNRTFFGGCCINRRRRDLIDLERPKKKIGKCGFAARSVLVPCCASVNDDGGFLKCG